MMRVMTGGEYLDAGRRLRTTAGRQRSGRRPRLEGKVHLTQLGDIEETLGTEYVGPARVWIWEVTRSRDESIVHHPVVTGERTENTR